MKFRVIYQQPAVNAQSPVRIVEQDTGREIGWVNRFLDREYVRRVAERTLRIDAYNLLHFVRWWENLHHTGDVDESDLTESSLLDYVRFQSTNSLDLPVRQSTIVWRWRIALCTTSSRTLPAKAPAGFISRSSAVGRWALVGRE